MKKRLEKIQDNWVLILTCLVVSIMGWLVAYGIKSSYEKNVGAQVVVDTIYIGNDSLLQEILDEVQDINGSMREPIVTRKKGLVKPKDDAIRPDTSLHTATF